MGLALDALRVAVHTTLEEARERWCALEAGGDLYAVQSFAWLSHWCATVGPAVGVTPCLVEVAGETGAPLLLLPLAVQRRGPTRILTWLGGDITDYQAPILSATYAERARPGDFARLWRTIEGHLPAHDVQHFERQPERVGKQANPVLELAGQRVHEVNHLCRLEGDWESLGPQLLGARMWADLRRKRRRLEERGSLRFAVAERPDTRRAMTETLIGHKVERYLETGTYNLFKTAAYRPFLLEPSQELTESGMLHVSALALDERPLASHWGLVSRGRLYYIMAGFEAGEWEPYSVGFQLIDRLLRWCGENRVGSLDFTVGDEPWKRRWSNERQELYGRVAARNARGWLFAAFLSVAETIRRRRRLHRLVSRLRNLRHAP